jgi:hypothetical protein
MVAVSAPFGVRCVYHPSGEPRIETLANGIASAYATGLYSGTPVKLTTDGTLIATATGADSTIGIFTGCFFISGNRPFLLPYWPAGQTYDANTLMYAKYSPFDPNAIFEVQADGPIAQTKNGEAANLVTASTGSVYTGQSAQMISATTTGATPGTFIVQNIAPYPDNAWGDAFTIVRVRIGTYQPAIA